MQKTVVKKSRTFKASGFDPAANTGFLFREFRGTIAVALATVAGVYFVALSVLIVILVLPLLLLRMFK